MRFLLLTAFVNVFYSKFFYAPHHFRILSVLCLAFALFILFVCLSFALFVSFVVFI